MNKTSAEELIRDISEHFYSYLKSGTINPQSLAKKANPSLNIQDLESLLKIHFILSEKVISFIKELGPRVRKIKTNVSQSDFITNAEIRGKINWASTYSNRCRRNPRDKTLFVYSQREREYRIPENIVLGKLLSIIHEIVSEIITEDEKNFGWFIWRDNREQNCDEIFNEIYFKNIYLKRIKAEGYKSISPRMIEKAKNSRNLLYREAGTLLEKYYRLMDYNFSKEEAVELLKNTFIKPDNTEVLFELYWIIKIIQKFKSRENHPIRLNLIKNKGGNIIASWEDEDERCSYSIYHDTTADLNFDESLTEFHYSGNDFLGRYIKVLKEKGTLLGSEPSWAGRPDILLIKRCKNCGKISSILIGEVKYSDNKQYVARGLEELLKYIAFVRDEHEDNGGKYFEDSIDILFQEHETVLHGILFVDRNCTLTPEPHPIIRIIRTKQDDSLKELVDSI